MLRSDIRTRVRDYLYESSADIWSDDMLNRLFAEEMNSLPTKDIYNEEMYTATMVVDQQDYVLPTGTEKVEKVERNDGSDDRPDWTELNGIDTYAGALWLPYRPTKADTMRVHIKKRPTVVSDDVTALDVEDKIGEVIVWGMVLRGYRVFLGYLRGEKSWDSVTKPGDVSIPSVISWLREAKQTYMDLIKQHATVPRPREMNLTS